MARVAGLARGTRAGRPGPAGHRSCDASQPDPPAADRSSAACIIGSAGRAARGQEGRLTPPTPPTVRRFADEHNPLATVIGRGSLVRGDLRCDGPVEVRGTLEGDCTTTARCTVHEGGRVLGNIDAATVVIAGAVEAGLVTAEKVEMRASASVSAAIRARVVAMDEGAYFQGEIDYSRGPSPAQ